MDKKSSPSFTMSSRLKETISKFSPGPTSYRENLEIVKPSGPNAVIGKASRQIFKPNESPAPGHYNVDPQLRPKSSCAVFSTYKQPEVRQEKKKVGPGYYQPEYDQVLKKSVSSCKFNKSPKSAQKKNPEKQKAPGPMTYDPKIETVHIHDPAIKFGLSLRIDEAKLKSSIPGPGKYNNDTVRTYRSESAFRFPKQRREIKNSFKQKAPGPLDYKIQGEFDSNVRHKKGFKICLDRKEHHSMMNLPGPTSYKTQTLMNSKRAPAFSISHTQRKSSLIAKNQAPGPNSYNPPSLPKNRAGSALITSSRRQLEKLIQKKQGIPGPGSYEKAFEYKTIGSGIKFTIPRSKAQKEKEKLSQNKPSPWSYNTIETMKHSIHYGTLGKSQRQSMSKSKLPGPGDYDIKESRQKGIKIGTQKRSRQKIQKIPGPSAYTIPSTIGNTPYYDKNKKK